jgi:hypothetical protein
VSAEWHPRSSSELCNNHKEGTEIVMILFQVTINCNLFTKEKLSIKAQLNIPPSMTIIVMHKKRAIMKRNTQINNINNTVMS